MRSHMRSLCEFRTYEIYQCGPMVLGKKMKLTDIDPKYDKRYLAHDNLHLQKFIFIYKNKKYIFYFDVINNGI